MNDMLVKTARVLAIAAVTLASASAFDIARAQQAGITRTDLQRHDISVPGHEAFQVRVDFAPGAAFGRHTHPGEEIIYVLEGVAEQWVGEAKKRLGPGEMALIPAGLPHMTFNPGPGTLKFLAILNNARGSEPMVVDCFNEEPWVSHFTPIDYPPV